MVDYHSLLARAVGGLPQSTPETRRSIYERARNALLGQLRISDPPASDADIKRESDALDAAIARLEAGIAATLQKAPELPVALATRPLAAPTLPPKITAPPTPQPISIAPPPGVTGDLAASEAAVVAKSLRPRAAAPKIPSQAGGTTSRSWVIGAGAATIVIACVAAAAIYLPNPPFDGSKPRLQEPVTTRPAETKPVKIGDRIGGPPAQSPAPVVAPAQVQVTPPPPPTIAKPSVPVAQRAAIVLQVTPEENAAIKTFEGNVVWRLENNNAGSGQPLQNAVRADIDIPEAKISASVVLQSNKDAAFPATHTLKIRFNLPAGGPVGTIKVMDVPEMREENASTGSRLIGLVAPIADNNFLAALAQGDTILARNVELLRNRALMDIPFQLETGQRGKLVIEKGQPGERIINEAMSGWGN